MKKLMVAAALAAMTVGAYADEEEEEFTSSYVYDLKISVKTTKGKAGKASKEELMPYGRSEDGKEVKLPDDRTNKTGWWYDDSEFLKDGDWAHLVRDDRKHVKTIKQSDIDKLSNDEQNTLRNILEPYSDPDISDGYVCLGIKWRIPAQCYRVSTSKTLTAYAISGDCCAEESWSFDVYSKNSNFKNLKFYGSLQFGFLYRIGGIRAKATKVEGLALSEFEAGAFKDGSLTMAGQGSFDKKNGLMKSISGNVAGYLGASSCPANCCDSDYAFAYNCAGKEIIGDISEMDIDAINAALKEIWTAAYGTWSLKYNASATKKLNALIDAE